MKIFISGAGGYIGSVLTPALLAAGHSVVALDTMVHGENSLAACCAYPGFEFVNGDARDPLVLAPLVRDCDVLIPLAAMVGAPLCAKDPAAAYMLNYGAIDTLCKMAWDKQRIIFPTTNSMYGAAGEETCTEESPGNPISVYAQSKCAAEYRVMKRDNSVAFRLATVFGASPRMRTDLMVNDFVLRAVRDRSIVLFEETVCRNFVHVWDVARAFMFALENWAEMKGRVFNLGDTRANMTKAALCAKIAEIVPGFEWHSGGGEDPDKRDYIVSNERLEATGWRPLYSLDEGIRELAKLYQTLRTGRYGNV